MSQRISTEGEHAVRGSAAPLSTVNILGVRVGVGPLEPTAQRVAARAERNVTTEGPAYVCATSVHGLVEASRDPGFRRILNEAYIVTPDGMPLVWFERLTGRRSAERVYGPKLMERVCALTADRPVRHFFYGGHPGVADLLARRMCHRFPGLTVAGTYCPPFRLLSDSELDSLTAEINDSSPDIVWVGLGTPKQERWIDSMRGRLRAKVLLSVGAAFDFHTGRVKQAPRWMQRSGLEWCYRLAQEPKRLWRRYAYNNPRFVFLAALQLAGIRRFPDR